MLENVDDRDTPDSLLCLPGGYGVTGLARVSRNGGLTMNRPLSRNLCLLESSCPGVAGRTYFTTDSPGTLARGGPIDSPGATRAIPHLCWSGG